MADPVAPYGELEARLRDWSRDPRMFGTADQDLRDAADALAEIARLTSERDRMERNRDMYRGQTERQAEELHTFREALVRLRDCDWVITPLDRMDAVRDIARTALGGRNG